MVCALSKNSCELPGYEKLTLLCFALVCNHLKVMAKADLAICSSSGKHVGERERESQRTRSWASWPTRAKPQLVKKKKCVIEPMTGQPYASLKAFYHLRQ